MKKSLILATVILAMPVIASASPILVPVMPAAPTVKVAPVSGTSAYATKALNAYRAVRSFWISRAIVR